MVPRDGLGISGPVHVAAWQGQAANHTGAVAFAPRLLARAYRERGRWMQGAQQPVNDWVPYPAGPACPSTEGEGSSRRH